MIAIFIVVAIASFIEILGLDVRWFMMLVMISLHLYKLSLNMKPKTFAYLNMFSEDRETISFWDVILCLAAMIYYYLRMGYLFNMELGITFPFVTVFFFYWLFDGVINRK